MKKSTYYLLIVLSIIFGCQSNNADKEESEASNRPNIIVIYVDDLGYGDIGANGATQLKTPNIDRLASGGVRFENGYASSATCTPSRFGLLTGVYPWRKKGARILPGTAPLLIDTSQMTIPKMLKSNGYQTAIVGKWHLGLGSGNTNWNEHISPGPNEVGFDYSYIMAATQDRVPTVYIKDGDVVGLDPNDPIEIDYRKNFEGQRTGKENRESLKMDWEHGHNSSVVNGIPRIGFMKGGKAAQWKDEDMADHFLTKAQDYIKGHKESPFFLYYAMQQPHVPRTPHERFVGKSGMGPRGDVIMEADWCIGELINTLEEEGLLEHTLIVFTSDNGPVLNDGYKDDAVEKLGTHTPSGPFRGGKYSLFEAGTHVPFITYWKGKIKPSTSTALVSQIDFLASLASLVESPIQSEDSKDLLDVFLGQSQQGREELILEASTKTAYRKGDWVMIPPYNGAAISKSVNIELGNSKTHQLYNLREDIGQQQNLAVSNPEKLQEMILGFEAIRGKTY
jgi:arylsulfatase A-like enzyme